MPRPSAALRSRLSLVHRRVGELIKTEAIRCGSIRPMPRPYKRRASIVRRTSLSCATRKKIQHRASGRSAGESKGKFRNDERMDHIALVKMLAHHFVSGAKVVDPYGGICENQFGRTLRRGIAFSPGIVLPRDANLRALSRSIRALRASRISAVFSATPVNSWAMRTKSSSSATVVRIYKLQALIMASDDAIICVFPE